MNFELAQSTDLAHLFIMQRANVCTAKPRYWTFKTGIMVQNSDNCDNVVSFHKLGDVQARLVRVSDRVVLACSKANLSPVEENKNLIPDISSRPGNIYVPSWQASLLVAAV